MHVDDRHQSAMDVEEPAFQLALNRSLKHPQHSMEEDDLAVIDVEVRELQLVLERSVKIQPMDHELQMALALSLQNTHLSSPDQCKANADGVRRRWGEDEDGVRRRWGEDQDGLRKNGQEDQGRTNMCNEEKMCVFEEDIKKNQGFHCTTSIQKNIEHKAAEVKLEGFARLAGSACGLSDAQLCAARQVFMCID